MVGHLSRNAQGTVHPRKYFVLLLIRFTDLSLGHNHLNWRSLLSVDLYRKWYERECILIFQDDVGCRISGIDIHDNVSLH